MTHTANNQELGQRIERLVQEQIEAIHRTAREALERAFAPRPRAPEKAVQRGSRAPRVGKRRAPGEVSALGVRLYREVCNKPGEAMAVLARELGASVRELHRPMALLKQAGRVKSVGQRSNTRYFPKAQAASA
jgi:hypothetical protein